MADFYKISSKTFEVWKQFCTFLSLFFWIRRKDTESENEEEIDGDDIDGDDDDESTDHSEESVDMLEDDTTNIIYEYSNSQYNNNYGHCAYCDRKNLKNVSGHIGQPYA